MKKIAALVFTFAVCLGLTPNALADVYNPTLSDTVLGVINTVLTNQNSLYSPYNYYNRYPVYNYTDQIALNNYYNQRQAIIDREMHLKAEKERLKAEHKRLVEERKLTKRYNKSYPYNNHENLYFARYR